MRSTASSRRRPRPTDPARGGLLSIGIAALSLLAALLVAPRGVDAVQKQHGIIFNIKTSQGISGRITYLKHYQGEGENFAQLEVEVLSTCVGDSGSYSERQNVILQGHTRGNAFVANFYPQNTTTDRYRQTARVTFAPNGRRGGLPRWRTATGTVTASRSINDPFVTVDCDSGAVSFRTTAARRARFGARPPIIVVI